MRDFIGVIGFGLLLGGLFTRYGWDVAAIIGGTILLALATLGAMRR